LTFPHSMRSSALGLEVTHAVSFEGPLSAVYGRLIGRKLAQGRPEVVGLVTGNALS
jgi:hypothetical protein